MARERDLQDFYFKEAKREGYRSRAAYKLTELDDRRRLLNRGDRVLDCGCAPGSWLQVIAKRVGPRGVAVGIDLKPITPPLQEENVFTIEGDLRTCETELLLGEGGRYDVVLSDMAPNTTGDRTIDHHGSIRLCHTVVDRLPDLLRPGGRLAMKVLEGEAYPELLDRLKASFGKVKGFKPKASRAISTEIFVAAHDYQLEEATDGAGDVDHAVPPKRRPPTTGWGAS